METHLVSFWNYTYHVLWNWAGILLFIDGAVALAERYAGEIVERKLQRKLEIPFRYKAGFAIAVLVIAQGLAYRDLMKELDEIRVQNTTLRVQVGNSVEKDELITTLKSELSKKQTAVTVNQGNPLPPINWYPVVGGMSMESDGSTATQLMLTPNRAVSSPIGMEIEFSGNLLPKTPSYRVAGAMLNNPGSWEISGRKLTFWIKEPDVKPDKPIAVTVYAMGRLEILRFKCINCVGKGPN